MLIGPDYRAPYPQDQGKDLGVKSWPPGYWKIGGGTVWGWLSYDPQSKTIYYGTSNPGPWNQEQRPGDNKFTAGVFARILAPARRAGSTRAPRTIFTITTTSTKSCWSTILSATDAESPVLIRPSRNGFFYVQDRRTGRVLSAKPYGYINVYRALI